MVVHRKDAKKTIESETSYYFLWETFSTEKSPEGRINGFTLEKHEKIKLEN